MREPGTYAPRPQSDDERDSSRELIKWHRTESVLIARLEDALDDGDFWRVQAEQAGSDSELAGEVELLREHVEVQRKRADALQYEVEQLRAARESLEPVGWMFWQNGATYMRQGLTPESASVWFSDHVKNGRARRVYLGPPEPIEEPAND